MITKADIEITEKEIQILGHTLGVNVYHAKRSKLKRDKKLPNEYYRNYFCGGEDHSDYPTLKSLEDKGFMERWESFDKQTFFGVTEIGKFAFGFAFTALVNPSKTAEA